MSQTFGRAEGVISQQDLKKVPRPIDFVRNLFWTLDITTPDTLENEDVQVPLMLGETLIGYVTYIRLPDGGVRFVLSDVPSIHGRLLTERFRILQEEKQIKGEI